MDVAAGKHRRGNSLWERYEGPTWVVAAIVYGCWGLLVWFHAGIPWWLMIPSGAVVIAWHNSLQHETIHALVRVPRSIRFALGFPPLALAIPYPIYCRSHRTHHRDAWLTDPIEDPESFYHREEEWRSYSQALRSLYLLNQTLLGRMTIGPLLFLCAFFKRELRRVVAGDRSNVRAWGWHAIAISALVLFVQRFAGMPLWQYALFIVYPGLCLGMLRSFFEHHYALRPGHRTAIVESGFPFNLLFLNNNLHLIHHLSPALPWYRIPAVWRASHGELLEHNGGFFFAGYRQLAAKHAFRTAFIPAQTESEAGSRADRTRHRKATATSIPAYDILP